MRGAVNITEESQSAVEMRSCHSKRRFASLKQARKTLDRIAEMFDRRMRPYHCSFCGGWHLATRQR